MSLELGVSAKKDKEPNLRQLSETDVLHVCPGAKVDLVNYLLASKLLTRGTLSNVFFQQILKRGNKDVVVHLVENGLVTPQNMLNIRVLELCQFGDPKILQYLIEKGWITKENFLATEVKDILTAYGYGDQKVDCLRALIEAQLVTKETITSPALAYLLRHAEGATFRSVLSIINTHFSNEDRASILSTIDTRNIVRMLNMHPHTYDDAHRLVIAFAGHEDFDGDIAHMSNQSAQAITEIKKSNARFDTLPLAMQMDILIEHFVSSAQITSLPETPHEVRTNNIASIYGKRIFDKTAYAPDTLRHNTLFLYIRQGTGEMCSLRACLIAKTLQEYIAQGKSSVFTDIQIVPYATGIYPNSLHLLGFTEDTVLRVSGSAFRELGNFGDVFALTNTNVKEFTNIGNTPMTTFVTTCNVSKRNEHFAYAPFYFDVQDKYSPQPLMPSGAVHEHWQKRLLASGLSKQLEGAQQARKNSRDLTLIPHVMIESVQEWERLILKRVS